MNMDPQMLEQIVAEVVRRLSQVAGSSLPAPSSAVPPPSPDPTPEPAVAPDTLELSARVVSTDTIHNRLKGIRTVVVAQRAIVTPSVRDEFEKKHIRLERRQPTEQAAAAGSLTVVRYMSNTGALRASSTLPLPAASVELLPDSLGAAVTGATSAVNDVNQLAVVVTDSVMAAVCMLNRSSHVRATQVRSVDETRKAIANIGVNVLVVDPRDMTANRWNAVIKEFGSDMPRGSTAL